MIGMPMNARLVNTSISWSRLRSGLGVGTMYTSTAASAIISAKNATLTPRATTMSPGAPPLCSTDETMQQGNAVLSTSEERPRRKLGEINPARAAR